MIYFVSDGSAIKIGRSRNVKSRIQELQGANAKPLALLGSVDGHSAHETKVHSELSSYRLSGEWFADCEPVRSAIARYMESGIEVEAELKTGPESEAVVRCRIAAQVLISRKMNAGQSKMQAYENLASEVGTNSEWLRKFMSKAPSGVKEPRLSVGLALLESAGLLVAPAKRTDRSPS